MVHFKSGLDMHSEDPVPLTFSCMNMLPEGMIEVFGAIRIVITFRRVFSTHVPPIYELSRVRHFIFQSARDMYNCF